MATSSIIDLYLYETRRRLPLRPGRTTTVRVRRGRPVTLLELPQDVGYLPEGVVPLPSPPGGGELSSLLVLAAALSHAERQPEERLLVTGHAPGDEDGARARLRAHIVRAYLLGRVEECASLCATHAGREEVDRVFRWACEQQGYDTSAGDPLTNFRAGHDARDLDPLPGAGPAGAADWEAALGCYDQAVGRLANISPRDLTLMRTAVKPAGCGAVGCGAAWPVERVRIDGHRPLQDARVDLAFFAEADCPRLACHDEGAGPEGWKTCDLYRKKKYHVRDLAPPTPSFLQLELVDEQGFPIARRACLLTLADGSTREVETDARGRVDLRDIPEGSCTLSFPDQLSVAGSAGS